MLGKPCSNFLHSCTKLPFASGTSEAAGHVTEATAAPVTVLHPGEALLLDSMAQVLKDFKTMFYHSGEVCKALLAPAP